MSKILIIGMGVLASVIVARTLGPSGKGVLAALGAMVGIALQFGNLGIHGANTYFTAKDKSRTSLLVGNSFWLALIIGLILLSSIYLFLFQHPGALGNIDIRLAMIALMVVPFGLLTFFWQNILVGLNKIKPYNLILIIQQFLYLIGTIIILLVFKKSIFSLVIFNTLTAVIITFLFGFYLIRIKEFSLKFNKDLIQKSLIYGFKVYLSCFFAYLVLRSDLFILNYFRGSTETGIYSIAAGFVDGIFLLPSVIGLLLLPKAVENLGQSGELIAKTTRISFIIIGIICLGAVIFGRPTINFMFGSIFDKSFIPLLILIPGAFFFALETIIVQYFNARGFPWFVVRIWLFAAVLNIGLNWTFIPYYGMKAAAFSSLLVYTIVFIYISFKFLRANHYFFKKLTPSFRDYKIILRNIKNVS